MNSKENQREYFFDILKGICIIFVIIAHSGWGATLEKRLLFPFWIDMAVQIFMIISGYVCSKSLKRKQIQNFEDAYARKYILRRFIRFTCPFAILYTVEIILYSKNGEYIKLFKGGYKVLLNFINGGYGQGSYYYPLMIQSIFVIPVVYFIIKKKKYHGLLYCGVFNALYELTQRAYNMNEECYRLLIFRYMLPIAFGSYMASDDFVIKLKESVISFIVGALFIWKVCYTDYLPKIIIHWTRKSFMSSLYIIPIIVLVKVKFNNIRCKPLEAVGKDSYHIFLFQMIYYEFGSQFIGVYMPCIYIRCIINCVICVIGGKLFCILETPISKRIQNYVIHL